MVVSQEVPEPTLSPDDVLVDMKAASANPLDVMISNGEFKQLLKYKLPLILGHDLSGIVLQVGSNVRDFKIGDEVFRALEISELERLQSESRCLSLI